MNHDHHLPSIVAGNAQAFGTWMGSCEPTVRLSLRSFASAVDTEAVLQESLLRVWQVAPRFVPDGRDNGLLRLAIRIARNLAVSELRKIRARPAESDEIEDALAENEVPPAPPDPMLRRQIADCRDKLPQKPREAFEARLHSEGARDDDDLATKLGMRLNTFLQNVTRARKLLAECLKRAGVVLDEELGR